MDDSTLIMCMWKIGSFMGRDDYGIITISKSAGHVGSQANGEHYSRPRYSWRGTWMLSLHAGTIFTSMWGPGPYGGARDG